MKTYPTRQPLLIRGNDFSSFFSPPMDIILSECNLLYISVVQVESRVPCDIGTRSDEYKTCDASAENEAVGDPVFVCTQLSVRNTAPTSDLNSSIDLTIPRALSLAGIRKTNIDFGHRSHFELAAPLLRELPVNRFRKISRHSRRPPGNTRLFRLKGKTERVSTLSSKRIFQTNFHPNNIQMRNYRV